MKLDLGWCLKTLFRWSSILCYLCRTKKLSSPRYFNSSRHLPFLCERSIELKGLPRWYHPKRDVTLSSHATSVAKKWRDKALLKVGLK